MDLRWIAGSLDSDSEALEPVLLWIRSESHRKRSRRRRVCLSWPYIICVLVDDFRSFNDATNQRMTSGQSFFTCVNSFSFTTSCWRTASHAFYDTILECFISSFFFSTCLFILVVPCLYLFAAPVKLAEHERGRSSAGRRAGGHESNVSDACGTHVDFPFTSFSSFPMAGSPFLNIRPVDRAIPARTYDTPPPTGQPAGAVWHRVAFREPVHSAGAEGARPSPARASVSRRRGVTWHEVSPNASHTYRPARDEPGYAAGSDRPGRRTCDSRFWKNI
jgi:hypothetical protein